MPPTRSSSSTPSDDGGWKEWSRHIILALERGEKERAALSKELKDEIDKLRDAGEDKRRLIYDRLDALRTQMESRCSADAEAMKASIHALEGLVSGLRTDFRVELEKVKTELRVKGGIWGAIAGAAAAALAIAIRFLFFNPPSPGP